VLPTWGLQQRLSAGVEIRKRRITRLTEVRIFRLSALKNTRKVCLKQGQDKTSRLRSIKWSQDF